MADHLQTARNTRANTHPKDFMVYPVDPPNPMVKAVVSMLFIWQPQQRSPTGCGPSDAGRAGAVGCAERRCSRCSALELGFGGSARFGRQAHFIRFQHLFLILLIDGHLTIAENAFQLTEYELSQVLLSGDVGVG